MRNQQPELWRVLMALIFPPLAVLDKGCGTATLVFLLTLFGWFPGMVVAMIIISSDSHISVKRGERRFVEIPGGRLIVVSNQRFVDVPVYPEEEKAKRKGAFIHLEDGEVAEIIEDDGELPERRKLSL